MPDVLVSVVVPTCDRPETLALCLHALRPGFQSPDISFEVIVTDDGKKTVQEMLARDYPFVTWTQGPRRGPAANRNNGVRRAKGRWLVFVDDDCVPDGDLVAQYASAIAQETNAKAFEGKIVPVGDMDRDLADCPLNLSGGLFWSANVCVSHELFDALGGFDEGNTLAAHEDQDLYIRLKPLTPVPFVPDARVHHPVRILRLRDVIRDIDRRNIAWVYFATRNASKLNYKNRTAILMAGYYNHLRNGVFALRRGYPKKFIYHAVMMSIGMPMQGARLVFGPSLR